MSLSRLFYTLPVRHKEFQRNLKKVRGEREGGKEGGRWRGGEGGEREGGKARQRGM